jgi:hypothetical protein
MQLPRATPASAGVEVPLPASAVGGVPLPALPSVAPSLLPGDVAPPLLAGVVPPPDPAAEPPEAPGLLPPLLELSPSGPSDPLDPPPGVEVEPLPGDGVEPPLHPAWVRRRSPQSKGTTFDRSSPDRFVIIGLVVNACDCFTRPTPRTRAPTGPFAAHLRPHGLDEAS